MSTTSKTTKKTMPPAAANKKEKMCSYPIEMTEAEKYLFDLNGYLIVRNVLTPEEVEEANSVIDRHEHEMVERTDKDLRNTQPGSSYAGNGTTGRMDLGQCLEWPGRDSTIFKSILAHPRLVPIFHELLGKGYRMDHLPLILAQEQHSEGFQLHGGTIDCTSGEYQPHLAYTYNHGMLRTALLGCNVILRDHKAGDGGFCIVPGSHKANFKMPPGMVEGNAYADYVRQPTTNAGDVILFSEGTVHGAKAWTSTEQRRTALYRFSPATNVYGRSYFGHQDDNETNQTNNGRDGWPSAMYDNLTPAQASVLEPPYANRLDRPNIVIRSNDNDDDDLDDDDGEKTQKHDTQQVFAVEITTRNERKKNHDQEVFGTKYF